MTDTSVRERCKSRLHDALLANDPVDLDVALDAILAELAEPTRGMKIASDRIPHARDEEIWRAMIQHIIEGGS